MTGNLIPIAPCPKCGNKLILVVTPGSYQSRTLMLQLQSASFLEARESTGLAAAVQISPLPLPPIFQTVSDVVHFAVCSLNVLYGKLQAIVCTASGTLD